MLDFDGLRAYILRVVVLGVGMRGIGLVMVGFGLTVMLAGLAYSGVNEWRPSAAAATWSFLGGVLVSIAGGILHSRT